MKRDGKDRRRGSPLPILLSLWRPKDTTLNNLLPRVYPTRDWQSRDITLS